MRHLLDGRSLGVLQSEPELFRKRINRRSAPLPRAVCFKTEIPDPATPRRNHASNGAEVCAICVLLIEATHDVRSHANEGAERGGRSDAVLASVPGTAKDERDLLEVVDEELPGLFVYNGRAAPRERTRRKQLLQLLCERRLCHAPAPDTKQLDLVVKGRVFPVVQRADDVVRGR